MVCEGLHDCVDRSRYVEKPPYDPSQRCNSGKHRAADLNYGVRSCSAHEHERRQNDSHYDHLHGLDTQIEGENPGNSLPAGESESV